MRVLLAVEIMQGTMYFSKKLRARDEYWRIYCGNFLHEHKNWNMRLSTRCIALHVYTCISHVCNARYNWITISSASHLFPLRIFRALKRNWWQVALSRFLLFYIQKKESKRGPVESLLRVKQVPTQFPCVTKQNENDLAKIFQRKYLYLPLEMLKRKFLKYRLETLHAVNHVKTRYRYNAIKKIATCKDDKFSYNKSDIASFTHF